MPRQGLQRNNYSPMGQGQPQNRNQRRNFMSDVGLNNNQQPIVESVSPGIPVPGQPTQGWGSPTSGYPLHGGSQPPNVPNISRNTPIGGDLRSFIQSILPQGGASPQALASIEPQLRERGISLQRNSAGDVRGRVYLPNPGGYQYGNAVDLVSQWGQPWAYTERREDAPPLPRRAPANELYNYYSNQLMPQQDDDFEQLLQVLLRQNEELI